MSRKYKFHNPEGAYFITFSVVGWIDLFTRMVYADLIIGSLDYCRKNKGMSIFGYCIMPSHIHLIFRAEEGNPSDLIRDFKGFTSRKLLREIKENSQESRDWLLKMFETSKTSISGANKNQLWQHHNNPLEIWSLSVFKQKLDYIHDNPIKAGFVDNSWDWRYSSAKNYADDFHGILEIDRNYWL